jgi:hypothetical protein
VPKCDCCGQVSLRVYSDEKYFFFAAIPTDAHAQIRTRFHPTLAVSMHDESSPPLVTRWVSWDHFQDHCTRGPAVADDGDHDSDDDSSSSRSRRHSGDFDDEMDVDQGDQMEDEGQVVGKLTGKKSGRKPAKSSGWGGARRGGGRKPKAPAAAPLPITDVTTTTTASQPALDALPESLRTFDIQMGFYYRSRKSMRDLFVDHRWDELLAIADSRALAGTVAGFVKSGFVTPKPIVQALETALPPGIHAYVRLALDPSVGSSTNVLDIPIPIWRLLRATDLSDAVRNLLASVNPPHPGFVKVNPDLVKEISNLQTLTAAAGYQAGLRVGPEDAVAVLNVLETQETYPVVTVAVKLSLEVLGLSSIQTLHFDFMAGKKSGRHKFSVGVLLNVFNGDNGMVQSAVPVLAFMAPCQREASVVAAMNWFLTHVRASTGKDVMFEAVFNWMRDGAPALGNAATKVFQGKTFKDRVCIFHKTLNFKDLPAELCKTFQKAMYAPTMRKLEQLLYKALTMERDKLSASWALASAYKEWSLLVRVLQRDGHLTTNNSAERAMAGLQESGLNQSLCLTKGIPVMANFLQSSALKFGQRVRDSNSDQHKGVLLGKDLPSDWGPIINFYRGDLREMAKRNAIDAVALFARGRLPSGELVRSAAPGRGHIEVCTNILCRLRHNVVPCRDAFLLDLYRRAGIHGWERNDVAPAPGPAGGGGGGGGGEDDDLSDDDGGDGGDDGTGAGGASSSASHRPCKPHLFDAGLRKLPDKLPSLNALPGAGPQRSSVGALVTGSKYPSVAVPVSTLPGWEAARFGEGGAAAESGAAEATSFRSVFRGDTKAEWSAGGGFKVQSSGRPSTRNRTREKHLSTHSMPRNFKGNEVTGPKEALLTLAYFRTHYVEPNSENGQFLGFHALRRDPVEDWADGFTEVKGQEMLQRLGELYRGLKVTGPQAATATKAAIEAYEAKLRAAYPPDGVDDTDPLVPERELMDLGPEGSNAVTRMALRGIPSTTANLEDLAFKRPADALAIVRQIEALAIEASAEIGAGAAQKSQRSSRKRDSLRF